MVSSKLNTILLIDFNSRINFLLINDSIMKKLLLFLILSLGLIGLTSAGDFETNILKLKATNSCVMCNLNGADFTGVDLSGANLSDTSFRGADFIGANLSNTDFRGTDLTGADLSGADLSGANLAGAELTLSKLKKADLSGANLSEVIIRYADISEATLCNTKTPWGIDNSGC